MKKHALFGLLSACIFLFNSFISISSEKPKKTEFHLATYNIRYQAADDVKTGNAWETRKMPLANVILKHGFDVIATQEGNANQIAELSALLPGFAQVGHAYGGKNHDAHSCTTFYREGMFNVLDKGVFWFSETPNVPSIGWDATDRRICYWTKFEVKATGAVFYTFNVHFYWRLKKAKQESGPLLISKIQEIAGDAPVFALGDFNSEVSSPQIIAIKDKLADAYESSSTKPKGLFGTAFEGGVFKGIPPVRIDYIFSSPGIKVKNYQVWGDQYADERFPSDHLPVSVRVRF